MESRFAATLHPPILNCFLFVLVLACLLIFSGSWGFLNIIFVGSEFSSSSIIPLRDYSILHEPGSSAFSRWDITY